MNPCEEIRQFWLGKFHARGEEMIPFLVNSTLSKKLWLEKYKELPPIEKMPEKEKKEMKQFVISMFPNKTTAEKLDCCRIIYTIGNLL